jgi:hypothetical protein
MEAADGDSFPTNVRNAGSRLPYRMSSPTGSVPSDRTSRELRRTEEDGTMLPNLRTTILAGLAALGCLLGAGARDAHAQFFVSTPRFSVGVGAPVVGVYPVPVGVVPVAPVVVRPPVVYPVPAVVYPRPVIVGPRPIPYGGFYRYGYRRW